MNEKKELKSFFLGNSSLFGYFRTIANPKCRSVQTIIGINKSWNVCKPKSKRGKCFKNVFTKKMLYDSRCLSSELFLAMTIQQKKPKLLQDT